MTRSPQTLDIEVAGLLGDDDLSGLPLALRRPGPQPCNRIAASYPEALARLNRRRGRRSGIAVILRAARIIRRWMRADAIALAAEVVRLRDRVAALERGRQ
jgi:hypothetical protein